MTPIRGKSDVGWRLAECYESLVKPGASAPGFFMALVLLASALVPTGVWAQIVVSPTDSAVHDHPPSDGGRAVLRGSPVAEALRVDGRLDERAWAGTDSLTDLREREPSSGAPVSERTVVRVLCASDAIYVGVRADDYAPGMIRAASSSATRTSP